MLQGEIRGSCACVRVERLGSRARSVDSTSAAAAAGGIVGAVFTFEIVHV